MPVETSQRAVQIRRVAAELFEASGYSATTISDIAKASGVLPGSLYHHFGSKEEIAVSLLEVLDGELRSVVADVSARMGDEPVAETRIRDLARQIVALSLRNGAAIRLHSYEAPSASTERFRSALRPEFQSLDRAWRTAVAGLVPPGHRNAPDLGLLRFAVQRLAINAAVNLGDQPRPGRFADHLCDLLLRGLVPDSPSDEELDTSAAMSAAREAVRSWPRPHVVTGTGSRADIVAAARAEFARRGYEATTIRDIAAAAGIWMGTLYRRVSSKEELLGEILGEYSDSMGGAVRSVLSTGTSVPASLDALAYVFVNGKRRFRLESEIVKFEWRAGRTPSHPVPEFVRDSQAHAALLGRVLKKGMAEGTLRRIAPAAELDAHVRHAIWLPFEDHARTGVARAHRFLRSSLLRGFA